MGWSIREQRDQDEAKNGRPPPPLLLLGRSSSSSSSFLPSFSFGFASTMHDSTRQQQYIVYPNISMFLRCVCVSMCVGLDDALDTGGQAIRLSVSMCVCAKWKQRRKF
jgi:hypothetical protein